MISFGPIPSRRLGKSLGINNILSPKKCSYGCVYCQVGKTKLHTIERQYFFEPSYILHEVSEHLGKLKSSEIPDYLTFVANGEPTLDVNLGETILLLKTLNLPIAVITNASLLYEPTVVNNLMLADWVSLKIDAPDTQTWQLVNQPFKSLNFETHITSILKFAEHFKGILCTETMLVQGLNDSETQIANLAEIVKQVNAFKSYLSIPTRPPAFSSISAPAIEKINYAWQIYTNQGINTELLIGFEGTNTGHTGNAYDDILNILAVHPLREDTVNELLKKDNADFSVIESLLKQQLIKQIPYNNYKFYFRNYFI